MSAKAMPSGKKPKSAKVKPAAKTSKTAKEPVKKKPNHRPKIYLDPASAEAFGRMKATHETMAEFFGVSHDTIARRMADPESPFCVAYKKGFAGLRMRLSEKQIQVALSAGNVTMLIWLGKQYLGQADKQEFVGDIHDTTKADPEDYLDACRKVMKEFQRVSTNPEF